MSEEKNKITENAAPPWQTPTTTREIISRRWGDRCADDDCEIARRVMKRAFVQGKPLDEVVIAVDFDGTLTRADEWPEIGEPREALIAALIGLRALGVRLILWTCRCDGAMFIVGEDRAMRPVPRESEYPGVVLPLAPTARVAITDPLMNAVEWCEKRGLNFDSVNANLPDRVAKYGSDTRKISCDFYVCDKTVSLGD